MNDTWERIKGPTAHKIEASNFRAVAETVESLVLSYLYDYGGVDQGCPKPLTSEHVRLIHQIATRFLLDEAGQYRSVHVKVCLPNEEVVHDPPRPEQVEFHMRDFDQQLARLWGQPASRCAAFALWRLNWIHPFRNGNGRTARAFTYAVICLKYGAMLNGKTTVLELMDLSRDDYYWALTYATNSFGNDGVPDLRPVQDYLSELINQQLMSV